ncbi:MAG: LysR family transcriptional regulator [Myxococcota bacterium]
MLDDLRSMAVFAHVARGSSFADAARELGVSRAAVSHQIRRLEKRLGVPLTRRSTRSLSLTPAGQLFAERCQNMIAEASSALANIDLIRQEPRGRVVITCSNHFGQVHIVPALAEFRRRYRNIELDVLLTDSNLDIVARGIDLAVRAGPLSDSSLRARRLLTDETFLCAAPSYLEHYGVPTQPEHLADHRWVLYPRSLRYVTLGVGGRDRRIAVRGHVRLNNAASRLVFVLAGEGIARLPAYDARPRIASGELVRILPECRTTPVNVYLVHPERLGPSARRVADFLVEEHTHRVGTAPSIGSSIRSRAMEQVRGQRTSQPASSTQADMSHQDVEPAGDR